MVKMNNPEPEKQITDMDKDIFMRTLIRNLSGALEDIIGHDEAFGYISLVGQQMGDWLNELYRRRMSTRRLSASQVAEALVDLKNSIEGNFEIREQNDAKIVLTSTACPFGDCVKDRASLCMMTSNVFGVIAAENLGYAKVELRRTLATGGDHCDIAVYLTMTDESASVEGREYFATEHLDQ